MSGDILIVDGIPSNRISMKVKLLSAFGDSELANSAKDIPTAIARKKPDLIVVNPETIDVSLNKLVETVHATKGCKALPVVAVISEDTTKARLRYLTEGASEVISQPVSDTVLHARLRAVMRDMHHQSVPWLKPAAAEALGFAETGAPFLHSARVAALCPLDSEAPVNGFGMCRYKTFFERVAQHSLHKIECYDLQSDHVLRQLPSSPDAVFLTITSAAGQPDLASLAALRTAPQTRDAKIIALLDNINSPICATVLDMRAHDVLDYQIEVPEIEWRLNHQINRKFREDRWKASVQSGLAASVRDPLTGLYNRRFGMMQLDRMATDYQHNKSAMAVILADLDHFKRINDQYGHAVGDQVLKQVGRIISEELTSEEIATRIGGEEFMILLPNTSSSRAKYLADRIRERVRHIRLGSETEPTETSITMSLGVVMADSHEAKERLKPDQLFQDVDKALYGSKSEGRDTVTFHTQSAA